MLLRKLLLACLTLLSSVSAGAISVAAAPSPSVTDDYFLYIPTTASVLRPLQILVTIHGMGGEGRQFSDSVIAQAEQNGWVVVSPTFQYRDYKVVANVVGDEVMMLPRLKQIIEQLPARTGLAFQPKVLLYGFSRGAQVVHRYAQWYPEQVLAVALFSAGSYTLPQRTMMTNGASQRLAYPFGVDDLDRYNGTPFNEVGFRTVKFFVGVGGADINPDDTPRDWDATQGTTRVTRAQTFYRSLVGLSVPARIQVFPGVGHDVNTEMRTAALSYLKEQADRYYLLGF